MSPAVTKPSVTSYLDFRQFLQDYFSYRKKQSPAFSYQTWADELGFKDRSFLRMILTGRRALSESNKTLLLEKMDFDELEALYFAHLVSMNNTTDADAKKYHNSKMLGLIRLKEERTFNFSESSLSAPKAFALYVLLGYEDIPRDVPSLAARLGESVAAVEEWIAELKTNDLIEFSEANNEWHSLKKSFRIPDSPGNTLIKEYHHLTLSHAQNCLPLEADKRKFRSLILALNQTQLENIWEKFSEYVVDILSDLEGQPMKDRELFHLNFNCVPVAITPKISNLAENSQV